jgi:hypothetical protein
VIKDRDDLIAELMVEEDSEDDSDPDSSPNYEGDGDGRAKEDLEEVPEGDAPLEHVPRLELVSWIYHWI